MVVVRLGAPDRVVLGPEGLDDDLARQVRPPGPAGHLGEELKGPLRGAEIRKVEPHVRRHHPHQGEAGEVVPLGHHLGPDEDVDLPPPHPAQDAVVGPGPAGGVPVEAADPRPREPGAGGLLDPFGPEAEEPHAVAPAPRAPPGGRGGEVAEVALEAAPRHVEGERGRAVRALGRRTAVPAEDDRGEPPAVQEQKGLLPPGEPLPDRPGQRGAEEGGDLGSLAGSLRRSTTWTRGRGRPPGRAGSSTRRYFSSTARR